MSRLKILRSVVAVVLAALLSAAAWFGVSHLTRDSDPELCAALKQHRLISVQTAQGAVVHCERARARPLTAAVEQAMRMTTSTALRTALMAEKHTGLAVAARPSAPAAGEAVGQQLSRLAFVSGLRAVALSPELGVYAPARDAQLSAREREGLAYVARALLRGAHEPHLNSFPPALRRVERVEVMVMLRERGQPRLWRSARGTSIARALLTAARVARERWRERESAMGGPLLSRLLHLDVEVSLLSDDGVLLSNEQGFVDRAVTAEHGVGFEYKSGWHYLLPEDVERRGKGSAYRALSQLVAEQGLSASVLRETAFRAYRFVPIMLGVSRAPLSDTTPSD